jgi:DnaD/phage-associated family protein
MARPKTEGLSYFPHDTDASGDLKIRPLLLLYGARGYGFYFLHLEYIYRNESLDLDVSDPEIREVLRNELKLTPEEYEQILQSSLKNDGKGCFSREYYTETGKLTSDGIHKRAETVLKKRDENNQRYSRRISGEKTNPETPPETTQKKVKESKEKEIKDLPPLTPPSPEDKEPAEEETTITAETMNEPGKRPYNPEESQQVFKAYSSCIAGWNDTIKARLVDWLSDVDPEVIIKAIDEAVFAGVRNWRYINKILVNWFGEGVRTGSHAEAHIQDFRAKQAATTATNNRASPPTRAELIKRFYPQLVEKFGEMDFSQFSGGSQCVCGGAGHWMVDKNGTPCPNKSPIDQWSLSEYQRFSMMRKCPHIEIDDFLKEKGG